ncbi:unnamed protein product [Tilletia controversa]|uniref:Dimethylargininase n=3 Tax=Tilletia TaxID=13289 RepID=A0A8X7SYP3_9BASI|nr:hypothetical protein CF336_g1647 [Tilletia laevis]KAE8202537.1 hypothetical protein CF328_g2159 [Tilletia controversa]KAE8261195.1 hypothetical protein A4X03_0g3461 [Tilletia caries]KAE8206871.1 hypothetical protein CF335_g1556 [Tilletia laevis]KAE8251477.1 hypothetical protein A4X06_0g2667 [Tilletia controversa]
MATRRVVGRRDQPKIIVYRDPSPNLKDGLVTHIADERGQFDHKKAVAQFHAYINVFFDHGWEDYRIRSSEDLPDAVFVEDTLVVFEPPNSDEIIVVLTNPGAPERQKEMKDVRDKMAWAQDIRGFKLTSIKAPGTLDGGDVLKDPQNCVVYCGIGGRTNAEGIRQLRAILRPYGYVVRAVPMTKALHLKSAATALPDGTVLLHRDLIDDVSVFPSYIEVPEKHGVAVVEVDDDTVVMSASAPKTAELIRSRAYKVITVDISEFERLEGCVTCLSVRFRRGERPEQFSP